MSTPSYPPPHIPAQQGQVNDQGIHTGLTEEHISSVSGESFTSSPSPFSTCNTTNVGSSTPTPTSTQLGCIYLAPDLSRAQTNSKQTSYHLNPPSASWITINHQRQRGNGYSRLPLNMVTLPSPKASMHLPLPDAPLPWANQQLPQPYSASGLGRENKEPVVTMRDRCIRTTGATATVALMMLPDDWRTGAGAGAKERNKGGGINMRDLLCS